MVNSGNRRGNRHVLSDSKGRKEFIPGQSIAQAVFPAQQLKQVIMGARLKLTNFSLTTVNTR
jgi:hypothetical protein